jgi:predicted nucleotide-binding protein (sugar kinase/HSP70/actin superfamily)
MYFMLQRRILDELGLPQVEMVTLGNRDDDGGLGMCFQMVAWDGLVAHDLLEKMLHRTRPYEVNPGQSDAIFQKHLKRVCDAMKPHRDLLESTRGKIIAALGKHVGPLKDILREAQAEFEAVGKSGEARPLVGLVGEFYVRLHTPSNQSIIRKLEDAGAEVWLAPLTEFFGYSNLLSKILAEDAYRDTRDRADRREAVRRKWLDKLAIRDEHLLFEATLPYLANYDEIPPDEMIEKGLEYLHWSFGGEAICSMGKSQDFAERGLDGVVSVVPFNCMPGITVRALSQVLRRKHDNLPFLNLDYDGFIDASRDAKVVAFMAQVRERWRSRRGKW